MCSMCYTRSLTLVQNVLYVGVFANISFQLPKYDFPESSIMFHMLKELNMIVYDDVMVPKALDAYLFIFFLLFFCMESTFI